MTTLTQDIIAKLTGYRNSSYDRHRRDRTSWFAEHLAEWEVEDAIRVFAPRSVPKWDWDNTQDDFDAIVSRVVANPAFADAFVRPVNPPELIVKATRNTRKLGVYYGATGNIAVWRNHDKLKKSAFWSEERAHLVILHELAHWAHKLLYPQGYIGRNKYAGSHGPLFKRVLAELWRQELGDEFADLLLRNWDSYDQRVAPGLDWYKQDNPGYEKPAEPKRSDNCSVPDRCGANGSYCSTCWNEHFEPKPKPKKFHCVRYPSLCLTFPSKPHLDDEGTYCEPCLKELYPDGINARSLKERVLAVPASYNGIVSLACEEPDPNPVRWKVINNQTEELVALSYARTIEKAQEVANGIAQTYANQTGQTHRASVEGVSFSVVVAPSEPTDEPDLEVPIRPAEANELHSDPSGLAPTRYGLTRILEAGLKQSLVGSEPSPRPKSLFLWAAEQKSNERGAAKQVVLPVALSVVGLAFSVWRRWGVLTAIAELVVSGLSAITWEHIAWGGYVLGAVGAACGLAVLGNKQGGENKSE